MSERLHIPVLLPEVLSALDIKKDGIYLDATFGAGGHTRAILRAQPDARIIALDWDKESVKRFGAQAEQEFPGRLKVIWGNFAQLYTLAKKHNIEKLDGILADFGTSMMQLFDRPGFSFRSDTPLDMRMSSSHVRYTAADIVNQAAQEELQEIFWRYAQERFAKKITMAIVRERKRKKITSTKQLVDIILGAVPLSARGRKIHPATKVFQALRIAVNKELENIKIFLPIAFSLLASRGRFACISFHSLEDRLVKQFYKEQVTLGVAELLDKRAITPSQQELKQNPASRSARLRTLMKL